MQYGYIRVSTKEQNIDRQTAAFGDLNFDKIFVDRQSGKSFDRPAYKQMMDCLCAGDLVIVKSIDRLGRNYDEVLEQWRVITKEKKADIFVIDFPLLDTRSKDKDLTGTFISDLVLQILSYVAQTEREFIRRRQSEGIAAAKQRGVKFGRPRISPNEDFPSIVAEYKAHKLSLADAVKKSGMSKSTFCRKLKESKE